MTAPLQELEQRAGALARADKEPGPTGPIPSFMRSPTWGSTSMPPPPPRRLLSHMSSAERKEYPITTGCLDYFPDALALVANVSFKGNQKHNPGQPLHHARGKSSDHADCILRHLTERDFLDPDNMEHAAALAWRALAYLQEMAERKYGLDLPRGATAPGVELSKRETVEVTGR